MTRQCAECGYPVKIELIDVKYNRTRELRTCTHCNYQRWSVR